MSLPPLKGNIWVPAWSIRWESYDALRDLKPDAMMLWQNLHSVCMDGERYCYASRETFGNECTVGRRLRALRDHHLLFDVRRPPDPHTDDHRTTLRWACDPMKVHIWKPRIEATLWSVAEQDSLDRGWIHRSLQRLDSFEVHSLALAKRLHEATAEAPATATLEAA